MTKQTKPNKRNNKNALAPIVPSTELALSSNRELTPAIWKMITEMAPVMFKSRLFGVLTPEGAAAIMLKGYELGLSVTASFEFVHVIQGKPSLSPRGAMAILFSSPVIDAIKVTRLTNKETFVGYECTITRTNGFSYTGRFTMEDALRAGLVKPDSGWEKYPENMCLWRAVGFSADVAAPDVIAGMTTLMKMPEAYGVSLTAEGDVIEGTATTVTPVQSVADLPTLNGLMEKYNAQQIMDANDGKIPATSEEVAAVMAKLESATPA